MKRFIIFTTAFLCLCVTQVHAYDFVVSGIYYNKTSTTEVEVTYKDTNYNSYSGKKTIPSSVTYSGKTYSVTSIGSYAFEDCSGLTSVTIGNSMTSIGSYAFEDCSGLTSVTIGNSVTSIGSHAFFACYGLTSISIPNSVTSIGGSAFYNCLRLTSVTIGNSVTSIGGGAFSGCFRLTSITIPNSVTSIGNGAFSGCRGLTSVTIPNSVTKINSSVFSGCSGLTSVTIPTSVTQIFGSAFSGCSGLTSIDIPNSVTYIGDGVFNGCSGLQQITVESNNSVYDSRGDCNAIVETSTNTLIAGCQNTVIPESVTSIGNHAFYECSGLTSVIIPEGMTSIGSSAFYKCSGLTSVIMAGETPPTLVSNPFNNINSGCVLYVPSDAAVTNYQSWASYFGGGICVVPYVTLTDGEAYNPLLSGESVYLTYVRSFNDALVNHMQAWYVPFDYTITSEDAVNFDFYQINFIAAAGVNGEVVDDSDVFLYVYSANIGETLKGNRPYIVKAKAAVTDYEFVANYVTLKSMEESCRLTTSTSRYTYEFYGTYGQFQATQAYDWMAMSRAGQICWNATAAATLGSFRWYLKVTPKDEYDDYTKVRVSIIDDENAEEATSIMSTKVQDDIHTEAIYNTAGQHITNMHRGLNIVKMTDGTTRKVFVK